MTTTVNFRRGVVVEEADESLFWIELIRESGILAESKLTALEQEAGEILAIMVTARNSARNRS